MQTFREPGTPAEPLPPLSDFINNSPPEVVNQLTSVWDELDDLNPQFSGDKEADTVQTLTYLV